MLKSRKHFCCLARPAALALLAAFAAAISGATQLRKETSAAFDRYVAGREAAMLPGHGECAFMGTRYSPTPACDEANQRLKSGDVIVESVGGETTIDGIPVSNGLIQDWTAAAFVQGKSIADVLALLQDYANDKAFYYPLVQRSELRRRDGNDFKIYLRMQRTRLVTVVLDTEYDVHYFELDAHRAGSRSYSTRIAEVENAGESRERVDPPGNDHGYLWRLNTYWQFYQADGGTYLQCESISLTRDIPTGLGWLVKPLVRSVPEEMLRLMLEDTRDALITRTVKRKNK